MTAANLNESIIADLQSIAETLDAGLAATKAQNLLCFHYQICYGSNGMQKSMGAPEKPRPAKEEILAHFNTSNAYPNPAKDYITVSYSLLKADESSRFDIFDGLGRQVDSRSLGKVYEGQELVDTRKLPSGVYLYQIIQGNKKILEGKFIVTH